MNCTELTLKLKEFNQPRAHMFLDPPDGRGGLYKISKADRLARNRELPWIVLSTLGDEAITAEFFLRLAVPEGSELHFGDVDEPEELKPIRNARLIERAELNTRGWDEEPAPAILLSL